MYDGQTTNSSVRNASAPGRSLSRHSGCQRRVSRKTRADAAEERNRAEDVDEERQSPTSRGGRARSSAAPGFQIIRTRIAKPSSADAVVESERDAVVQARLQLGARRVALGGEPFGELAGALGALAADGAERRSRATNRTRAAMIQPSP